MNQPPEDMTPEQTDEDRRTRRRRWLKRGGYGVLVVSALIGAELSRRNPAVADAAVKTTRAYAPRPNKDVSGQPRDAQGRFTA